MTLVVATAAVACGGGSDLTKDEYVAELNAMCRDFLEREKEIGEPRTFREVAANGARIADLFEDSILEPLRRLDPPKDVRTEHARLLELAQEQHDVLRGLATAAQRGDYGRAGNLAGRNDAINTEANAISDELGAKECGSATS